jgi:hypothetical protein
MRGEIINELEGPRGSACERLTIVNERPSRELRGGIP